MKESMTILPVRIESKLLSQFSKLAKKRTKEDGRPSSMNYEIKKFILSEVTQQNKK